MRKDRRLYCLCVVLFLNVVLFGAFSTRAQTHPSPTPTPTASPTPSLEKEFFKNILRDQKAIWTSPFHLDRGDAKWIVPSFMERKSSVYVATIPADYTDSVYPLQYYFELKTTAGPALLYPGFSKDLMNQPYFVLHREDASRRSRRTL